MENKSKLNRNHSIMAGFVVSLIIFGFSAALAAPSERIIGGEIAADGQFPYLVSLRYKDSHACAGSIIDATTILSAGHCVYGHIELAANYSVVTGINRLSAGGDVYRVKSVVHHEDYNADKIQNDISIVKLATPIRFDENVSAVKLPTSNTGAGVDVTLSGWGMTKYPGPPSDDLMFVPFVTIDHETCKKEHFLMEVIDSEICTFAVKGEGACKGDSGGPLIDSNGVQVGIDSWSVPCAVGYPDVFTRVYSFLDWIEKNRY